LGPTATAAISRLNELADARRKISRALEVEELGKVESVSSGVAVVSGLPGVAVDEVVRFAGGQSGLATDLAQDYVGVTLLSDSKGIAAGTAVVRSGHVLSVPVGAGLLGRVIDPLGKPLDDAGPVPSASRLPVERPATPIFERDP